MYCIHCGKELPDEAKFCSRCGKDVAGTSEKNSGTYSYVFKRPKKTESGKTEESPSGTYSYVYKKAKPEKKEPPRGTAGTSGAKPNNAGSRPASQVPPRTEGTAGSKPASQVPPRATTKVESNPKSKPAGAKEPEGSGCCFWIFILACILVFYALVIKPKNEEKKPQAEVTTPTVTEATQSREELEKEARAARLPGVWEDYQDLSIFDNRQLGPCKRLEGCVAVKVIFVDDAESSWTQEEMDQFVGDLYNTCTELSCDASMWGRDFRFGVYTSRSFLDYAQTPSTAYLSFSQIASNAGYDSYGPNTLKELQAEMGSDSVAVIVAFNKRGRAYACPHATDGFVEACYIFDDASAIKHEMLHLFGAADFYYHDDLDRWVTDFLGDSVMSSSGGNTVDDLTAYLIGWTDTLSSDASMIVTVADMIGEEALKDAQTTNSLSGFATKDYGDGAVYTGMLEMGVPHGVGEIVWANGDRYYGDWDQGTITGFGTYYWVDGGIYEGEFVEGMMHGRGIMTFANGQIQSGTWENGEFVG